jgi:hypothetical protein
MIVEEQEEEGRGTASWDDAITGRWRAAEDDAISMVSKCSSCNVSSAATQQHPPHFPERETKAKEHVIRNRSGYKTAIFPNEELGGTTGGGLDVPRAK